MRLLPPLLLALLPLSGCEPTCASTCEKLLSCEEVEQPRVAEEDCEAACLVQQELYEEDWENQQLRDALGDAKRCVRDEECEAIADGACYDPDLYIF